MTLRIHGPVSPQASKWAKEDHRTANELEKVMTDFMIQSSKRYNEEKNIDNLLDKILSNLNHLKNNNRNFQLILVDDGSFDTTFEKLKSKNLKDFSTISLKTTKTAPQNNQNPPTLGRAC